MFGKPDYRFGFVWTLLFILQAVPSPIYNLKLFAQDSCEVVARFQFDGNMLDSSGNNSEYRFKGTPEFVNDALNVNREYSFWRDESLAPPNYRFYTPGLKFDAFTVAIRFKRFEREGGLPNDGILTAGPSNRWFHLAISESGKLLVRFNNWDVAYEIPWKMTTDQWTTIVCGVDFSKRKVKVYVNGEAFPTINLNEEFDLRILKKDLTNRHKSWSFVNPGNGDEFIGRVDEFALFNGEDAFGVALDFSVEPIAELVLNEKPRSMRGDRIPSSRNSIQSKQDTFAREDPSIQRQITSTSDGAIDFLKSLRNTKDLEKTSQRLIENLRSNRYAERQAAEAMLIALGPPARRKLEEAAGSGDNNIAFRARLLLEKFPDTPREKNSAAIIALDYLCMHPSPQAFPVLLTLLEESEDQSMSIRLAQTLVCCTGSENREKLRECLAHPKSWVRLASAIALKKVADPQSLEPMLTPLLDDKDELVQIAAASALVKLQGELVKKLLTKIQKSPSFSKRYLAHSLLDEIKNVAAGK